MAETAIQFLERWRQARVYAELRALEQLDETVAECIGAAAEDGNDPRTNRIDDVREHNRHAASNPLQHRHIRAARS